MYLIIDNNVTHCLVSENDLDASAIISWLWTYGKAVAGGELLREYSDPDRGNMRFVKLFNTLSAAGRAILWDDESVDIRAAELEASGTLRSNDPHVIALAQVSRARALWSRDRALRDDFTDKSLISDPRGKLYFPEGSEKRRAAGLMAISRVCERS